MSITPGKVLGPYRILSKLGSGGMGEVYQAHDDRLERDVALKVLPPDAIADTERLERFVREARTLAALNHPHIVTIYSTEEAEGNSVSDDGVGAGAAAQRADRGGGWRCPASLNWRCRSSMRLPLLTKSK